MLSSDDLRKALTFLSRDELANVARAGSRINNLVKADFPDNNRPYYTWSLIQYRFMTEPYMMHHLRITPMSGNESKTMHHKAFLRRPSQREKWSCGSRNCDRADEELLILLNEKKPFKLPMFIRFRDAVVDAFFPADAFQTGCRRRYFGEYLSRFMSAILQAQGVCILCRYNNIITNEDRQLWNNSDKLQWTQLAQLRNIVAEAGDYQKRISEKFDGSADVGFLEIFPLRLFRHHRYVSIVMEDPPMNDLLDLFFTLGKDCVRISVHHLGLVECSSNELVDYFDQIFASISQQFLELREPLLPVQLIIAVHTSIYDEGEPEASELVYNPTIRQPLKYDRFLGAALYRTWTRDAENDPEFI